MIITVDQLAAVCAKPDLWVAPLNESMELFEINTRNRVTMFLASCAYESGQFETLSENLNYSAQGLTDQWPERFPAHVVASYARHPQLIANRAYANRNGNGDERSGDGWRYLGRGPIQITGRANYLACEADTGLPLIERPDLLLQPDGGSQSAAWFFWKNGCNDVADEGDFAGVSGIINRGSRHKVALHMERREQWLDTARAAIR